MRHHHVLDSFFPDDIETDEWVLFHGTSSSGAGSIEQHGLHLHASAVTKEMIDRVVAVVHPCLLSMRKCSTGWRPERPGWGLVDFRTGDAIDPTWLVSDERFEVTDWELLDFAVQVVKQWLDDQSLEIMSSHSNPGVHPNIWFVSEKGLEWVIVKATRYPDPLATLPSNWREVAKDCEHLSSRGHFAPVAFALDQDRDQPIWRGYAADAQFDGLQLLDG